MLSISQLLNPPTADQVFDDFIAKLVALGLPADKWATGGTARLILRVVANLYAGFAALIVLAIGGAFLPTSAGDWLTLLAFYVYGVIRSPATYASGLLTLVNSGGAVFTYGAHQAVFLNSTGKQTYTNDAPFTLGALATLTIPVTCTVPGATGSAAPGEIDSLVTVMQKVTCSNAAAVVGIDAQTDADLRTTCLNKLGARSVRGPRTAYAYYATHDAEDQPLVNGVGNPVNINRVSVSASSHTGAVTVTLASPSGAVSSDDLTAADDSIQLNAVPDAVTETTVSAAPVSYAPVLTVWAKSAPGLAASTIQQQVEQALEDFLKTYPIGGQPKGAVYGLFASGIDGVVKGANAAIFAVDGSTDLVLAANQVAVDAVPSPTVRLV